MRSIKLCVLVILFESVSLAQNPCVTPVNGNGLCVPALECPYIKRNLERFGPQISQVFRDYVLKSRCTGPTNGYYVCCEAYSLGEGTAPRRPIGVTTTFKQGIDTTTVLNVPNPSSSDFLLSSAHYERSLNFNAVNKLLALKCGPSNDDRVAYGNRTDIAEFPWMALLGYVNTKKKYNCGGSLITNRYVLTAAHCIRDNLDSVRLGEWDLSTDVDCQNKGAKRICAPPVEDFGIERKIAHPLYNRKYLINDIGLIRLDRDVEFKKHIKPVCLPLSKESLRIREDQEYLIAGWGTTEDGTSSGVLLKATIPHIDLERCKAAYKPLRIPISENHICAVGENGVDACKGDSGGPLFFLAPYNGRAVRNVQFGVVSFGGATCGANSSYPGVYANVANFMPWITNNIE